MSGMPLHGEDVAPRFCSADEFTIAELDRVNKLFSGDSRDGTEDSNRTRCHTLGISPI